MRALEIGLYIVTLLVHGEFVDVIVGLHCLSVVLSQEGGHSQVVVNHLALLRRAVSIYVCFKYGLVVIKVEGELRVIEEGVLAYVGIETEVRRLLETLERTYLVLYLYVRVSLLIISDLAKRIGSIAHTVEILYGASVVTHGI